MAAFWTKHITFKRSFAGHLSVAVLLFCTLLFLMFASLSIERSSAMIRGALNKEAFGQLEKISLQLEKEIVSIEVLSTNIEPFVHHVIDSRPVSDVGVQDIVREVLEINPNVLSFGIALDPSYVGNNYFCMYGRRENDSIIIDRVGGPDHDYTLKAWFRNPYLTGQPYWSDPITDPEVQSNGMICSYTSPLYGEDGAFIGVCRTVITLSRLAELMTKFQPYEHSYNFMLGKDASYVVYPQDDSVIVQPFSAANAFFHDSTMTEAVRRMQQGGSGMQKLDHNGKREYLFFKHVPSTQWAVALVCPYKDVYGEITELIIWMIIFLGVALVVLALFLRAIVGTITHPIRKMSQSALLFAAGDFDASLPEVTTEDEVRDLNNSLDYMRNSIMDYMTKWQENIANTKRIESELSIAHDIQMDMLPRADRILDLGDDVDIAAVLNPAREVGGDFYDFSIDGNRLYLVIGDVSGKGMPSALLMAVTQNLIRTLMYNSEPLQVVRMVNTAVKESNHSNMFVTLFLGVLDLESGQLRFCSAGHDTPFIVESDGSVHQIVADTNIPLGCVEDYDFQEQQVVMNEGSTIVLYTDGITEAENEERELYGPERLAKRLFDTQNCTARQIIERITTDVVRHSAGAPQSDDITMLVAHYIRKRYTHTKRLVLRNQVSDLALIQGFVEEIAEEHNLDAAFALSLELVLEEASSNVVNYAFPGDVHQDFEIRFTRQGDMGVFDIVDDGVPFNPVNHQDPDVSLPIENRMAGGLGIFLVRQLSDEISYCHKAGRNILTIKVNFLNSPKQ